ncbi:MAG: SDR family oxidoreductase [Granulosicoccaceae bacterium]
MTQYTAVITGGSNGIGAELALRLLEQGYTVISIDRNTPTTKKAKFHFIEADLLDPNAVTNAADKLTECYEVTHLIHNAGLIWPNLIEEATPEEITGLAQLHLGSALTLLQASLPNMKKHQFGRVMFNASRAALGAPTRTAYSASKAGMIGMARTWALELAQHGITVNVVAPGPILTDNFWDIIEINSPQQEALAKRIPVGRLGTVQDVSNAFIFFCNPENSFITGQTLYVCGGASVGSLMI